MGAFALYGLAALVIVNILFYGAFGFLIYMGIKFLRNRRYIRAAICLLFSTAPIFIFSSYQAFLERESQNRLDTLSALSPVPISEPQNVRSLAIFSAPHYVGR